MARKSVVRVMAVVVWMLTGKTISRATEGHGARSTSQLAQQYTRVVYDRIDFSGKERLSYEVFAVALRGYMALSAAGKLDPERHLLTVCNMDLPSSANRLWVIDLATGKVLINTMVAHGQGTGDDCAQTFSNQAETHASSLGFYVTSTEYKGAHGLSMRLEGMDAGYNDAAMARGIVVHGADYVSEGFVANQHRLGRSWGCPAVANNMVAPLAKAISGGTCLFIYYPEPKYLATSAWLNGQTF